VSKRRPFSLNFILGNRKKSQGARSGEWGGITVIFLEVRNCRTVSGCVVMMEKPIFFLPLIWTFAPNALTQPLQNLTVKLPIDSLTREYKFLVDNALDVEKNDQHGLDIAVNLTCFFRPQ